MGTDGYVEQITISTTTKKTFDRADAILPDSDLISSQVTSWSLRYAWVGIKVK